MKQLMFSSQVSLSLSIFALALAGLTTTLPIQADESPQILLAQDEGESPAETSTPAASPAPAPAPAPVPAAPAATPAAASNKGKDAKKPEAPHAEAAPLPPPAPLPDCHSYLATPSDGAVIEVGRKFYFVSPKLPNDKTPGTTYLVEVDTETLKGKRLAGFRGGRSATLLGHGHPMSAASILDFEAAKPDCGEGKTSATAIQWLEQKVKPSYAAGNYAFVKSDDGSGGYIADLDKGSVLDIDLLTGQKRTLNNFMPGTRPVFIKTSVPIAIYVYSPKERELNKYINNQKKPDSTLRLKEGMRLVQQSDQFGIMQIDGDGKTVKLSQIKGWSGSEMKNFDLKLPAGVNPSSLAVNVNFTTAKFLLFGKDEAARRDMARVLYFSGKDLKKTFKAPPNSYFSAAKFGEDSSFYLLLNDISTNVVKEFWWSEAGTDLKKIDVIKEKKAAAASQKK